MSIIEKIKSVFRPKAPNYKSYTASELKIIAMRTRLFIQQHYKKCIQVIQAEDSILLQRKDISTDCYHILQQIGKHVVQAESIKMLVQILRKIQNQANPIIKTNGDISQLKHQINWFRCLLWYWKCKKTSGIGQLYNFCFNFFKGVDITSQINLKCQIFTIYPIFVYLQPECVLPLKKIYPQITQYINTKLSAEVMIDCFNINNIQIKKWAQKQKIQYIQRFMSKSKSPLKAKKSLTPKKKIQTKLDHSKQVHVNEHKNADFSQNKSQMESKSSKLGISFMKKIIQSSKLQQNIHNLKCNECGNIIQETNKIDNNQQQIACSFPKICSSCAENAKNKKSQPVVIQNTNHKICEKCNKQIKQYKDYSFSLPTQQNQIVHINQGLCEQCFHNLQNKPNQHQQQINNKIIQQDSIIKQIKQSQKKHSKDIQVSQQRQNLHQQTTAKQNQKSNQLKQVQFDDQQDSLRFIRQTIVQKKKPLKKPYMVSIYARAQFIDQHHNNNNN